ncbi:Slx4p interacting protein [Fusarium poae]|uniref:hypothetical protein n=1 Tax=Fusarium poae TaxID=36050 RepID=UPI001CEB0393|nr:hypothetical protein FPOAC1_008816 [Fusarium poae]KAG8669421.1 hypothetical protein FPOAC1_008816 [Fusarium poae]
MSQLPGPIPALYTVYVLRSSVRHASFYIGSTPAPPRRLKQHNGVATGGAVRTAKDKLRPWEAVIVISGFPSSIAALKFEWALTNPHLTSSIPSDERITKRAPRKKGQRKSKRPIHSAISIVSNLHLLTGVPTFARWPLTLHFFAEEIKKKWDTWLESKDTKLREGLRIETDYKPEGDSAESWGIHALPLNYAPLKPYVEKAHNIVSFEREGDCVHCHEPLQSGSGLHPICPHQGCEAMGHLECWGKYALQGEDEGVVVPLSCRCPSCDGNINWIDMMKELTLRIRGPKEVTKLLKKPRRTKKAIAAEAEAEEDI